MPVFISLLRGINVGGNKKIKMADLKSLYESLGFKGTQTLLQSGNAVFETDLTDVQEINRKIESGIIETFGFESKIIMRTVDEWKAIVKNSPFTDEQLKDPAKVLVLFMVDTLDKKAVQSFMEGYTGPEIVYPQERELFVFYTIGMGNSKLDLDKKLKLNSTGRNWNTISKLLVLAEGFQTS